MRLTFSSFTCVSMHGFTYTSCRMCATVPLSHHSHARACVYMHCSDEKSSCKYAYPDVRGTAVFCTCPSCQLNSSSSPVLGDRGVGNRKYMTPAPNSYTKYTWHILQSFWATPAFSIIHHPCTSCRVTVGCGRSQAENTCGEGDSPSPATPEQ